MYVKTKNETLRIGHLSTIYHTNFILLKDRRFSKEIGKKVIWKLYGTGPSIIDAFRNNELDLAYIGIPPAMVGIDQGVKIRCIAGGHVEGTLLISKKENYKTLSQFDNDLEKTLRQFEGNIIGVPRRGSIHDVIINHFLNKFKLSKFIEIRNYSQAELIALDIMKENIVAGVGTPSLAIFSSTLFNSQIIVPPNKLCANNPSYGIIASENLIQNDPDILKIFLKFHKKATILLRKHPKKAAFPFISKIHPEKEHYEL
ncbi:MAG: ABC transporter substrate-binding protein [Candidatus Lokiarchaeota archaeon]